MLNLQGPGLYSHCLVNPKLPYLFSLQYFTPVTALLPGCEVVCLPGVLGWLAPVQQLAGVAQWSPHDVTGLRVLSRPEVKMDRSNPKS